MILDCESFESTVASLANLFRCSKKKLLATIDSFDLENIYKIEKPEIPSNEYIYHSITALFGSHTELTNVCWFHLTRTRDDNSFQDGILPLGQALPHLWSMIFDIFDGTEHSEKLLALRDEGVKDFQYQLKTPQEHLWGPYAMLVRESAWRSKRIGSHDYLGMPEIVEDICNGYKQKYSVQIVDTLKRELKPCIVKFVSNSRLDSGCIEAALNYIYTKVKEEEMSIWSNTCFDGNSNPVSRQQIIKVEFV